MLVAGALVVVAWVAGAIFVDTRVPSSSTGRVAIKLNTDHNGHLAWQDRMVLTAKGARLERVTVADAEGVLLTGAVDRTATTWRSTAPLVPDLTYAVHTDLVDQFGRGFVRTTKVTTTPPKQKVTAVITPATTTPSASACRWSCASTTTSPPRRAPRCCST